MTNSARTPIVLPPALSPLIEQQRWVVWRWIADKAGKRTKPPLQARAPHKYASSTDPATWSDFDTAMRAYCAHQADGIGYALNGGEVGAFDIDHCIDAATGGVHPWAEALVRRCGSYAEVTPSKTGIRIIGLASGPELHRKFPVPKANGMSIEVYRRAERYITISGNQFGDSVELVNIDVEIDIVASKLDSGKQQKETNSESKSKQHDLDSLIRNGCGDDFGGDRSRAVWYVINQLLKQGKSADEIVGLLLDRANRISAHIYDQSNPEKYARRQVEKAQQENGDDGFEIEIKRLTKLGALQYARERAGIAERFGIGVAVLDKLVNAERRKGDDGKQGRAISFPEREPWSDPVDGVILFGEIADAIRRHVVVSDHCRDTSALWAAHTYLLDQFLISPRLAIRSPTKQCGKTTLLDVLERLVFKPLTSGSLTSAVVFRVVEAYRPTLLIDEADTFLHDNEELRGVLNTGHRVSGTVTRNVPVGDSYEPRQFSTYSALAIAIIGNLPETLHDRSVVIDLKRRLPSETIAPFYADRTAHLDVLARKAARWCRDHAEEIKAVDGPELLPPGIFNREGDNWRPLLSIAQIVGGDWPERARKAVDQGHDAAEDESRIALLLGDIEGTFIDERTMLLRSADLVKALVAMEGRPWAEYGKKSRKPISQNQLARALKPLGISPELLWDDEERKPYRGYQLVHFTEAFNRYLPPRGASQPLDRYAAHEMGTSDTFQTVSEDEPLTVEKCEKSNNDGVSNTLTVAKGDVSKNASEDLEIPSFLDRRRDEVPAAEATDDGSWPPVCEHCGTPERPSNPVHPYTKDGQTYLLHPACWTEWLAGPDPDGWTFNLDDVPEVRQ